MYEENNSQDKPVVIGIDHGFSLMKTKHHIFSNGIVRCNGRPPVVENSFYYDGGYYCIGGERKTVHEDKTADEDFYLLTLVAVAKEIKTRGLPRTLSVVLGVGVLFKRFGKEQAKLVAYLKRSGTHFIEFEEEDYVITIENVYCFPRCFAADIEGMLDERGFDRAYSNILYVGGGATIMRRFGNARENAAYLEDIRLNAKGYEILAIHQMNKR